MGSALWVGVVAVVVAEVVLARDVEVEVAPQQVVDALPAQRTSAAAVGARSAGGRVTVSTPFFFAAVTYSLMMSRPFGRSGDSRTV